MSEAVLGTVQNLKLELVDRRDSAFEDLFELNLVDQTGNKIFSFTLPEDISYALGSRRSGLQVAMSPSGQVAVVDTSGTVQSPIDLDELIKTSLTEEMLEDEWNLREQLEMLRSKLCESLDLVTDKLSGLPEHSA